MHEYGWKTITSDDYNVDRKGKVEMKGRGDIFIKIRIYIISRNYYCSKMCQSHDDVPRMVKFIKR